MLTERKLRRDLNKIVTVVGTGPGIKRVTKGVLVNFRNDTSRPPVVLYQDTRDCWMYIESSDLGRVDRREDKGEVKFFLPHDYYTVKKYNSQE